MAHEITENDQVILHKQTAWHGLGIVVDEELSPSQALELAGLDYAIEQRPCFTLNKAGEQVELNFVANFRQDMDILMGCVGKNYVPVQNRNMAEFCEALLDNTDEVKIETLGTIQEGRRIWMLLKGQPFGVAKGDEMLPYILVSNGHDGSAAFRVTPTTVRAVCSNTLHMVVPRKDTGELLDAAITIRHTVNIMKRIEDAKAALAHYHKRFGRFRETIDGLAKVDVKQEDAQRFFLECYTEEFGEIPMNPQNKVEENRRNRAMSAYANFSRRFDDERHIAGASAWNSFNAWSGLIQHDRKARGQNDVDRVEKRVESNLFGLNQDRTQSAFRRALQMAS